MNQETNLKEIAMKTLAQISIVVGSLILGISISTVFGPSKVPAGTLVAHSIIVKKNCAEQRVDCLQIREITTEYRVGPEQVMEPGDSLIIKTIDHQRLVFVCDSLPRRIP